MSRLTDDASDPELTHGVDSEETSQAGAYLVLSPEEIAKGFIRPVRKTYIHSVCGVATTMSQRLAETYARDPEFYGATYCVACRKHLPVGDFQWEDGSTVGT